MNQEKALNKTERFVCEMTMGGVPLDVEFIRKSKLFEENMKIFNTGVWNELFEWQVEYENKNKE